MATKLKFTYVNPETQDKTVLAEGILGQSIIEADGNYYVSANSMQNMDKLQEEKDAYTCPYKGQSDYFNLVDESGEVVKKMATWQYKNPNPGWEQIAGRFGFPQNSGLNDIEVSSEEVE